MRSEPGCSIRDAAGIAFVEGTQHFAATGTCGADAVSAAIARAGIASARTAMAADMGHVRSFVGGGCGDGAIRMAGAGMDRASRGVAGPSVEDGIWSLVGASGDCSGWDFVDGRRRAEREERRGRHRVIVPRVWLQV